MSIGMGMNGEGGKPGPPHLPEHVFWLHTDHTIQSHRGIRSIHSPIAKLGTMRQRGETDMRAAGWLAVQQSERTAHSFPITFTHGNSQQSLIPLRIKRLFAESPTACYLTTAAVGQPRRDMLDDLLQLLQLLQWTP